MEMSKQINEEQLHDRELERLVQVRAALNMFHEICLDKNSPAHPCRDCPIWSICGTIPGGLNDATIEKTATVAAAYFRMKDEANISKKEAAADAENTLPVQSRD